MLPAIDLDHQARFETREVHNIRPQRHLAPKLESFHPALAQDIPHPSLGLGHGPSQLTRTLDSPLAHDTRFDRVRA